MRWIFPVFALSVGGCSVSQLPEAAFLALFLSWGMRQLVLLLTWAAAGSVTLTTWAVSTSSFTAKPALTQASEIQKHRAWATERKWGSSSRAAWLCAGVSTGLAAHRTGKTVKSRPAPAACLHYKRQIEKPLTDTSNSSMWGGPWGSTSM